MHCLRVNYSWKTHVCFCFSFSRPLCTTASTHPPEEHSLAPSEVTPCISQRVLHRLITRWCNAWVERERERRHGNSGPCGAWRGVYASALSRKHHSAIGPGAECSLTPVCRPRLSVAFHSPSFMLTSGLSAAACRHVSIFPSSLSLSLDGIFFFSS